MNRKFLEFLLVLALVFSAVQLNVSLVRAADVTTSVTVTKFANDNATVLDQITITVEQMMNGSAGPIYGDGVTHYYHQGPSFNLSNLWDSGIPPEPWLGETVNVDSRDYGAAKGNDVKDLCEMLSNGGASSGDIIRIRAVDGFYKYFDYEDVYAPEPEQGKMIITWYTKDAVDGLSGEHYVTDGSYNTGMRLLFFAETLSPEGKHVFGNWDMHETLAESRWHYYYDGTFWPSSSGLSVKWVSDIIIYSSEEPPEEPGKASWPLNLMGADIYIMNQQEFESGAECHEAVWVDGNNTWTGIPLWLLVGYVDDEVRHGEGAFNDELAAAGYEVTVIAFDNYTRIFASADVARNDNLIVANKLNGAELPVDFYPLRLVGADLSSGEKVSMITKIRLIDLPTPALGIELDRDSLDYGTLMPGQNSTVKKVSITNIGTLDCNVKLEVAGADATAQDFYEQSLYIDGVRYNIDNVISSIKAGMSADIDTQLQITPSWSEGTGLQEATFIFWATASSENVSGQ